MKYVSSYKHYVIQKTDASMQSIAQKLYGDIEKWRMLVNLNHLKYPYLVDSPQEKLNDPEHLLTWGDMLLLPNDQDVLTQANRNKIVGSNTAQYQPDYYDTTMGMDLKLNISTDVPASDRVGVLESDNYQFKRVVGAENLKQSLLLRILTRRGTLLMHPNYGSQLPNMLGQNMSDHLLADASLELRRTILTDPRVRKVTVTKERMAYNEIYLDATVTPIDSDTLFDIYIYRNQNGLISIR